jgi:ankyrin repeat protein
MSFLKLPHELLMGIASFLDCPDLNTLVQCHSILYNSLNDHLYRCNVQNHGSSALFWAASTGSESTLQRLLDAGANVQWESEYLTRSQPYVGTRLRSRAEGMKEHPISYAAMNGHIQIVSRFLDLGVDINYRDPSGLSPLALAAREGHFALVQMLVIRGAKQLSHDTEGRYPLAQAASGGHHEIEDYLFNDLRRYRYRKTSTEVDLYWMLKYAAERGDEDRIRYLLSQGADVNFQLPVESQPALCSALEFAPCPVSTAKLLLENGADPNIKASWSKDSSLGRRGRIVTPIKLALERGESHCLIELLLQYGVEPLKASQALMTAVDLEKVVEFRLLVEKGANVFAQYRRMSVARAALKSGCQPIVNMLLERGITLDNIRM